MRLLFDAIGAQTNGSRVRGIGRYTRELALALAETRDPRIDLRITMSGNFPGPAADLAALLEPLLPPGAITSYTTPVTPEVAVSQSNPARRIGEAIMRRHIAGIRPDCLIASSLYEVDTSDFAFFDMLRQPVPLSACIAYDFIPLIYRKTYLKYPGYRRFYEEQTDTVASADLLFAISESTRRDAIDLLRIDPDRIVTISGAADAKFHLRDYAPAEIDATLARLGIRKPFVFCVGGPDPRKNAAAAVDAFLLLGPQERQGAQLVMLVPFNPRDRATLAARATRHGLGPDDLKFLDRIDDGDLAFLYAQAELFLFPSLYEGFGLPLLEAMQCGAAVIAGNNSSLPEIANRADVLCDTSSPAAIARKIAEALRDPDWRRNVRAWGVARARDFSWASTAKRLQDGLLARASRIAAVRPRREPPACLALSEALEWELSDLIHDARAPDLSIDRVAAHVAASAPHLYDGTVRRLLVDVSAIVGSDLRTGIQRVVRNVVRSLYLGTPDDVTPVAVRLASGRLRTCQAFVSDLLGCAQTAPDVEVEIAPGDHILMLDTSWTKFMAFAPVFEAVRACGGLVATCVYDLIPEVYKVASVDPVPHIYGQWLRAALLESDGLLTISQAVMHDLCAFVRDKALPVRPGLRVGWFHCGSEIDADSGGETIVIRPHVKDLFDLPAPVFLMVGTIEPRKGHLVALEAFERLWQQGSTARLLIVGRKGWHVDALVERIETHPRFGTDLIWLPDGNDAELDHIYGRCAALLCPSYAEGFGLPVAEAARAHRPVLCSDIPVFREIGRDGALYFRVNDSDDLARLVGGFLAGTCTADPARVLQSTWADASRQIVEVVMHGGWSQTLEQRDDRPGAHAPASAGQKNASALRSPILRAGSREPD